MLVERLVSMPSGLGVTRFLRRGVIMINSKLILKLFSYDFPIKVDNLMFVVDNIRQYGGQ